ncbi:hypothetical protein [Stutzerimonas zhaodongensis]|uniref:hypothetical protein n=1 Tax=Stutzerimonas zhaodongensis TaxID=1176257 RepID=UPI001F4E4A78|nr:hypothetical protein [Stutzerimonas zhaodongensis]UNG19264.1 hypothetical protein MKP10_03110 [Stutzerimonas zhaodongensis]
MQSKKKSLLDLREELQECEYSLSLVVDISTSDIELSEGGRLGFVEFGMASVRRLHAAVEKLGDYAEGNLPS